MTNRNEYLASLPPGTGFCFADTESHVWVVRATARYGRYTIATALMHQTPTSNGVVIYTIMDWELNIRGQINTLPQPRITTTSGEDEGVRKLVGQLDDTRKRFGVQENTKKPLSISEVIFALPEAEKEFPDMSDCTDLEHTSSFPGLTKSDRCDGCGAQAYVSVRLRECGRRLLFCGHHYNKYSVELATRIDAIRDQREELAGV